MTKRLDRYSPLKLHRESQRGEVSIGDAAARLMQNLSVEAAGTISAVNTHTLGVAANSIRPSGKGGARNSSSRESHALKRDQVKNLFAATRFAGEIGLPFNRMINIHWEAAGIPLSGMVRATGHFMDLLSKTIARLRGKTAWIWIHEGGQSKGGHVHILVHVPPEATDLVIRLQKGWLKTITGNGYKKGVICTEPIGPRRGVEISNPALHHENLETVTSYILKGVDPSVASELGLVRLQHGGRVIGKRCATSQNIGSKARAKARGSFGS